MARPEPLEGVNLLDLTPKRLAEWREGEQGRVVITRPRPAGRSPRYWTEWLGYHLSVRRIRLDRAGSAAWRLMNGRRNVAEVAAGMRAELGDEVEPVEERLGQMVRALRREGLVAYVDFDDLSR